MKNLAQLLTPIFFVGLLALPAQATPLSHAEGVGDYSYSIGGSHAKDTYGDWLAYDFTQRIINMGGWYTREYENDDVWDKDFADKDRTSQSRYTNIGTDDQWFDANGVTFSFYAGHGTCPPVSPSSIDTWRACQRSSDCTGNKCGSAAGCVCVKTPTTYLNGPPIFNGTCMATWRSTIIVSSTHDTYGTVDYGADPGKPSDYWRNEMALGEDTVSGSWAGVGTNGGTKAAYISSSCGAHTNWWTQNLRPIFAGLLNIGVIMPLFPYSDTYNSRWRGDILGYMVQQNQNATVDDTWTSSVDNMTEGCACPGLSVGYGGICGCGANLVTEYAQSYQAAYSSHVSLTWNLIKTTTSRPSSNGYNYGWYHCNYDCNLYPMSQ